MTAATIDDIAIPDGSFIISIAPFPKKITLKPKGAIRIAEPAAYLTMLSLIAPLTILVLVNGGVGANLSASAIRGIGTSKVPPKKKIGVYFCKIRPIVCISYKFVHAN